MLRFSFFKWLIIFLFGLVFELVLFYYCKFLQTYILFFSVIQTFVGFIIGLGAVIVIDLHGFLAQKSKYWTESTIRAHKVTKPLIWIGIINITGGKVLGLFQTDKILSHNYEFILILLLILNGCFLSFVISPALLDRERKGKIDEILPSNMQNKIKVSFVFSVIGWWGLFFSTVFSLIFLN